MKRLKTGITAIIQINTNGLHTVSTILRYKALKEVHVVFSNGSNYD